MWRLLVALLVLLPAPLRAGDDNCGRCCQLGRKKERTLRNLQSASSLCMDSGDEGSCEIAIQLAAKYQELCDEYEAKCMPQLRAE